MSITIPNYNRESNRLQIGTVIDITSESATSHHADTGQSGGTIEDHALGRVGTRLYDGLEFLRIPDA